MHPAIVSERLDALRDIPLRGFDEIDDITPSSGTASLPTPLINPDSLHHNDLALGDTSPLAAQGHAEEPIVRPPPAPLLKDHDSFTEGSRAGSFDFLSAASGDLCYPIDVDIDVIGEPSNSVGLSEVGLTVGDVTQLNDGDASMSIEEWRANISSDTLNDSDEESPCFQVPGTAKRPRSPTPEVVRRIRPRSYSLSSASSAANSFDWFAPLPQEHDRPPSRASSAPG
ncbi:hypothetical protein JOM56_000254 [Amanita muscaria]